MDTSVVGFQAGSKVEWSARYAGPSIDRAIAKSTSSSAQSALVRVDADCPRFIASGFDTGPHGPVGCGSGPILCLGNVEAQGYLRVELPVHSRIKSHCRLEPW